MSLRCPPRWESARSAGAPIGVRLEFVSTKHGRQIAGMGAEAPLVVNMCSIHRRSQMRGGTTSMSHSKCNARVAANLLWLARALVHSDFSTWQGSTNHSLDPPTVFDTRKALAHKSHVRQRVEPFKVWYDTVSRRLLRAKKQPCSGVTAEVRNPSFPTARFMFDQR
eukprot:1193685-Prorocentrum_minimum.AAC.1